MTDKFGKGIAIGKASITELRTFDEASHAHRDDYHLFFLQEKGTTPIDVDFQKLNISTHYLNECVKNTTGQSISSHIQQRIILEAKRLLYHSDKSIKEIAAELGYDDYPYFSRLFTKVAGMSPKVFKKKNSV
ncbi:methylphosphotriester-DNA--protein-cysteine methyltransferase [Pedobacter cryoconitis]|uniref:Methylphosphotriester-DNA--protein-cysteine methyltransferase n=1 Tax=Pedobacter cryoconitis TaxID=188932 RepID=A0A7W8ZML8_9SPHI|nr:helix-turn-helix domain-containing protein [Pedobacter cryoconitis]MBB5636811.1 methylphosphotriester-DNA--protein-cysteine methyltransferase [Pedobacter cryoconitis]